MNKFLNYKFIAIEGNIGAGKTSLATKLATTFNTHLILEEFEENAFLPKFYEDPTKYAFQLELSFLTDRYKQLKKIQAYSTSETASISDYFFLKSLIFAAGNLKEEEKSIYTDLFNILHSTLQQPDLFVYLHQNTNTLLKNIKKRGRPYEQNIKEDYLKTIEKNYFTFFQQLQNSKILILDIDNVDFLENPNGFQSIINEINREHKTGITHKIVDKTT